MKIMLHNNNICKVVIVNTHFRIRFDMLSLSLYIHTIDYVTSETRMLNTCQYVKLQQ